MRPAAVNLGVAALLTVAQAADPSSTSTGAVAPQKSGDTKSNLVDMKGGDKKKDTGSGPTVVCSGAESNSKLAKAAIVAGAVGIGMMNL